MRKLALSAASLVVLAGLSAPALAASLGSASSLEDTFNADLVLAQLQERGIEATDVSEWGELVKATVTLADGSSTFRYFERDTLTPVVPGAAGGNTRVLTELDTGAARPVLPAGSLAADADNSDD